MIWIMSDSPELDSWFSRIIGCILNFHWEAARWGMESMAWHTMRDLANWYPRCCKNGGANCQRRKTSAIYYTTTIIYVFKGNMQYNAIQTKRRMEIGLSKAKCEGRWPQVSVKPSTTDSEVALVGKWSSMHPGAALQQIRNQWSWLRGP